MKTICWRPSLGCAAFLTLALILSCASAYPQTNGIKADLRSSSAVITTPIAGGVLPTAPAGGVVAANQPWVCDASAGFAPVIVAEPGVTDSFLAIGTPGNIKLPISSTTVPATCGQSAFESDGFAYVTQAVVDTRNTPSSARGVLRVALDQNTGAFIGASSYIATTAGLDGNQPTAAALGPDGKLYVGFLKNGNGPWRASATPRKDIRRAPSHSSAMISTSPPPMRSLSFTTPQARPALEAAMPSLSAMASQAPHTLA